MSDPAPDETATQPTNLAVLGARAREAKADEDWQSARAIYLEALAVAPGHPVIYDRIAEVEVRLGLLDEAVDHLAALARLGGTTSQIDEAMLDPLREHPGFPSIAEQIRDNARPQEPAEIFVTFDDSHLTPEGIAWDATTGDLFVGSFLLHKILRIADDGTVSDFGTSPTDDLGGVLGLWVDSERRQLWAVSGTTSIEEMTHPAELVRYDVDSGELTGRFPAPETDGIIGLNDVVATHDGTAWVTESFGGGLYRVPPGGEALELFLELPDFGFPNGIGASADGTTIYVGHAEGLSAIDPLSGAIERVVPEEDITLVSADGVSWVNGYLVLVQNQPSLNNRVVLVELDATGRRAVGLRALPCGLPPGLDPYTSAVGSDFVYVTASPPITPDADLTDAPPPAIVRLPL